MNSTVTTPALVEIIETTRRYHVLVESGAYAHCSCGVEFYFQARHVQYQEHREERIANAVLAVFTSAHPIGVAPEAATEDEPTFSICATHRPQVAGCPLCHPSLLDFLLVIHPSTSGDDGNKVCATCVDSGTPTPYPCATLQAAAHFTSPVPAPSGLQRATEQE